MSDNRLEIIKQLSPAKRELLIKKLRKEVTEKKDQGIPRYTGDKPAPLSFSQERMWFLNELQPDNPAYNIFFAARIKGILEIPVLQKSIDEIIKHHEAMRIVIGLSDGKPVLIETPAFSVPINFIDITDVEQELQESTIRILATEEAQKTFDLTKSPLFSFTLLKQSEKENVLFIKMHHIISDGWSMRLFVKEMSELYEGYKNGNPVILPELPIQYRDFSYWQRNRLKDNLMESQMLYWKQQLGNCSHILELPTDHPRPISQRFKGAIKRFSLSPQLGETIRELCKREGVTLFMTLISAFYTLLYRYTYQEEIVVGTPIANRNYFETERLIGCFVNTLALRTELNGEDTFKELLLRVRNVCLGAYANQDMPFDKLVEVLHPQRDLSRQPIFQVMFILQNTQINKIVQSDFDISPIQVDSGVAKFDLTLELYDEDIINGWFEYNTDLFNEDTIERMIGHLKNILEGVVKNVEQRIADIDILGEKERSMLLEEWNNTEYDYPEKLCLHQQFEKQAEKNPDGIAVIFEEQQLTYKELNLRVNQLAHYLRRLGVGPDTIVGVLMDRSLESAIALEGILKAGGAYLPFDTDCPKERLTFMLEDAQVPILVTQERHIEALKDINTIKICIDANYNEISKESIENPVNIASMNNLAYVIYTSGSTGKPKGAKLPHLALFNRIKWAQGNYKLNATDRVLQKTPMTFDVSVWEYFWPLAVGAGLVMARPGGHKDSAYLVDVISEKKVTTIQFVPSMLRAFLEENEIKKANCLRRVISGGEALSVELHDRFFEKLDVELHNQYGPTEAAIDVTYWKCYKGCKRHTIPIGHPLANTKLYILDKYFNPVPIGVPGELHICGDGLASGYLNRPELTNEKFISNPFSDKHGGRLYKTGDLVRYANDGSIEFIGRIDHQVKIRGLRIELGEIEAMLLQHPDVHASAVIVWEGSEDVKRLVAYIVMESGKEFNTTELRSYLKAKLPDYMVPAVLMNIDALPLTTSGKLDKRGLPAVDFSRDMMEQPFAAPRNHVEETLAGIWADILKLEEVGIHDRFFELGGDSILSIQVVARARQSGIYITPKQIFEHQTIEELAQVVNTEKLVHSEEGLVTGRVPLTPVQHYFFEQKLEQAHHFNQAVILEVEAGVSSCMVENAIQQLLIHHDALRMTVENPDSGWGEIEREPDYSRYYTVLDLSTLSVGEQKKELLKVSSEMQASLDLAKGSIFKAVYFNMGAEQLARLVIIIHHLVVDGISWRVLLEDLQTLCKSNSLPQKTTSLKYWAEKLASYAQSTDIEKHLSYWQSLSEVSLPALPSDFEANYDMNTEGEKQTISVFLGSGETKALLDEVPAVYHTQINDILLTALTQAFAEWSGQNRLLVDLEGHGREDIFTDVDISRTVGWFTTIFPVLLDFGNSGDIGEKIVKVKETLREIPCGGLTYGLLKYLGKYKKQLSKIPKGSILFNYLGQFDQITNEDSLFKVIQEPIGTTRGEKNLRSHLLEVNALIGGGVLQVDWEFSRKIFNKKTVEKLAKGFIKALEGIIQYCKTAQTRYTPSDFPMSGLTQQKLNEIVGNNIEIENIYPLAPMQQAVLSYNLFSVSSGTNIQQLSWLIEGDLDIDLFKTAWQKVVDKYAILRTSFIWKKLKKPLQVVFRSLRLSFEEADWSQLPSKQKEQALADYMEGNRKRGFKVSEAPLMCCFIACLGKGVYRFVWSYWTSLFDNWSWANIIKEAFQNYKLLSEGNNLPAISSSPFSSYIQWIMQQDEAQAADFWRNELKGFNSSMDIGIERRTQDYLNKSFDAGEVEVGFTEEETKLLTAFIRKYSITLGSLLQGAWVLLLSQYSGQEDILYGVLTYGRPASLKDVDSMVGLFSNNLPVRVRVEKDVNIVDWLRDIQDKQVVLRQYDYVTVQQIAKWSLVPLSVLQRAIYDRTFIFVKAPEEDFFSQQSEDSVRLSQYQNTLQLNIPLRLYAEPSNKILIRAKYDSATFSGEDIQSMLRSMKQLLGKMSSSPDVKLYDLIKNKHDTEL
ncbi:non-ribosomal peptide synthetase [Ruminiclostridium cellulolyticum]|uniref:Amino acid adenylation domain protein n=1 Tax=Ruminiclostridium cellulolyticum (strain ATCC 35319 / DSM 5812 / JCM 6584 / H10) TaxID=394503 RepID=B8I984_RUMCH|nr:non-ribosomal peptide synthetase [Ruminiclostridium cellulolyticum]ACL75344.1 amino acid adenylation domain protein [Ruminiclostridium cellulolyticum H10]